MYNKNNFKIVNLSKDGRGGFKGKLYCHPKYTCATNGYALIILTSQNTWGDEKFTPFIIDSKDAQIAEKTVGKDAVFVHPNEDEVEFVKENGQRAVVPCEKADIFPNIGEAFPKKKERAFRVTLNPKLLKEVIDLFVSAEVLHVELTVYKDAHEPIKLMGSNIKLQKATALVMPMRK